MKKLHLINGEVTEEDNSKPVRFPEYDFIVGTIKVECTVQAVPCGADIFFTADQEIDGQKFKQTVLHVHIHPKWWWKYCFKSLEKEIEKTIKDIHNKNVDAKSNHKKVMGLRNGLK